MSEKTLRDHMTETGENMSWCKPVHIQRGDRCATIIQTDSALSSAWIDGKRVPHMREMAALCAHLGLPPAIAPIGVAWLWAADAWGHLDATDRPCRDCPEFAVCDLMDDPAPGVEA